jgi:hypothetical protein
MRKQNNDKQSIGQKVKKKKRGKKFTIKVIRKRIGKQKE